MKTLDSTSFTNGERILVRASLDVPYSGNEITDLSRFEANLDTIRFLQRKNVRVILIGHLKDRRSFKHLSDTVQKILPHTFIPFVSGPEVEKAICEMKPSEVILLENLRSEKGEEMNDQKFTSTISAYADKFVFDAFSVSHRKHASVIGIPQHIESVLGMSFHKEMINLHEHRESRGVVGIFGGGKLSTKVPLLLNALERYEKVFVGGILANSILLKRGVNIGESVVEKVDEEEIVNSKKIITPEDVVVSDHTDVVRVCSVTDIKSRETILDIGPSSVSKIQKSFETANHVVWNGPLGWYEKGCSESSLLIAEILFKKSKAKVVVGGGDSLSVLKSVARDPKRVYFSLSGGAMLSYLTKGTTEATEAIRKSPF